MRSEFSVGDRVEAYIPKPDDPEHRYHGKTGRVVDILEDDLSDVMDNPSRGNIYTVEFDDPSLDSADFRFDDLQTPD
ncbi:hypothetical protein C493_07224 [Natronolimnohabitans innermongolicus JCM 12255]|uniref:DUF8139 domain-containing protein n=2 Tax=Natronolimnohabitans innermongolicus TaxID=253107 RepID=L9XCJ9_9EURY|nr:hypothetical protein C493_07224 [Natronolimnohabitans innermongolicus JCM 12255]